MKNETALRLLIFLTGVGTVTTIAIGCSQRASGPVGVTPAPHAQTLRKEDRRVCNVFWSARNAGSLSDPRQRGAIADAARSAHNEGVRKYGLSMGIIKSDNDTTYVAATAESLQKACAAAGYRR